MIPLERHIEILLLNHDCVVVPGFGGFVAHHSPAYYDDNSQELLPPYRTLGFNPSIQMNDSLLAQSYVDAYDISYPEALRRIDEEVGEIREHLANEGRYEMNDIGTIVVNDEGNTEFIPCEAGLLTPSLYGLSSVEIKPLAEAVKPHVQPVVKVETKAAEPVAEDDENEGNHSVNIRLSVLRNVAAACIAIVAYLLIPKQITTESSSAALNSEVGVEMLSKIMPAQTQVQTAGQTVELNSKAEKAEMVAVKAESKAVSQAQPAKAEAKTAETKPYWAVVVAARISKGNAKRYAEDLRERGYKDARELVKGSNVKVICGQFSTEGEARKLRRQMSDKEEFAQCWVTKVNP